MLLPPRSKPASSYVVDYLYSLIIGTDRPGSPIRRYHLLYGGSRLLARTRKRQDVLCALQSDLHSVVAVEARRWLFVRAGVVEWRGRAIVLPGGRSSGTTTLVEALIRSGARLYSDEYAVFDPRGRVHPYPMPPSFQKSNVKRNVSVEALRGSPVSSSLPVGLIALTRYKAWAKWHPRILSPGQTVLALLAHTVSARDHSDLTLEILARVAGRASALAGSRGEAGQAVEALLAHIETDAGRSSK